MTFDIGIDFTVNSSPPRRASMTDWEARLIEHCLGRYLEAAIACADVTVPLARNALAKIVNAQRPVGASKEIRDIRAAELRMMSPVYHERVDEIEGKWAGLAQDLAEALQAVDPDALTRIQVPRADGQGPSVQLWLSRRRAAKDAPVTLDDLMAGLGLVADDGPRIGGGAG